MGISRIPSWYLLCTWFLRILKPHLLHCNRSLTLVEIITPLSSIWINSLIILTSLKKLLYLKINKLESDLFKNFLTFTQNKIVKIHSIIKYYPVLSYFSRYSAIAILIWWLRGLPPLRLEKLFSWSNCISSNLKPTAIFLDMKTYLNIK